MKDSLPKAEHEWVVCAPYNDGRCVRCGQSFRRSSPITVEPFKCEEAQKISSTHKWKNPSHVSKSWECEVCGVECSKHRHVPYFDKTCEQVIMEEALT